MADFGRKQRLVNIVDGFFTITLPDGNVINPVQRLGVNIHNFKDAVGAEIKNFIIEMFTHGYGFEDDVARFVMKLHSNNINVEVKEPDHANRFEVNINFKITYRSADFDYLDTDIDDFLKYFEEDFSTRIYTVLGHRVVIKTDFQDINFGQEDQYIAGGSRSRRYRRSRKSKKASRSSRRRISRRYKKSKN